MKLTHFSLLLALLAASFSQADFETEFAALKEIAAERTERAREGVAVLPSESRLWRSDYVDRVTRKALALYEQYPTEPRRWEAALILLRTPRSFLLELKPGYDEAFDARDYETLRTLTVTDEDARDEWDAKIDSIEAALLGASDVPPEVLARAYSTAVYRSTLRRGATQAERWARVQELLTAMQQRVEDGTQLTRALEIASRLGPTVDPEGWDTLLRTATQSPVDAVSSWAIGKSNLEAAKVSALDMRFTALDGREVDLAKLRGKVVLLDFWATWCGPCKEELPNILAAYRTYHDQGFEVVAVSLDTQKDKQKLLDYVREHDLPWPQHFDGKGWKNEFATKFGIRAIPAMFLLDQSGKVASTNARGSKLEVEIRRLLGLDNPDAEPAAEPHSSASGSGTEGPPTELLAVGAQAPDFVSHDLAGAPVNLSDYRGKIVILDFWATWCGPCIASMPHTQAVADRYADQDVVVLAVCTGDKRKRFEDWVKLKANDYPALRFTSDPHEKGSPLFHQRASRALYGVPALPTQFIIDRAGKVAGRTTGYIPGDNALERALADAGVEIDPDLLAQPSRLATTKTGGDSGPSTARPVAPAFTGKIANVVSGDLLPEVEFRAADGTPRKLSDYRGQPLVLFLTTAEMIPPDYLNELVMRYGADQIQVLALVTRDSKTNFAAWQALHGPRGHHFATAFDPAPASQPRRGVIYRLFQFGAPTPFAIVIDADGRFVGSFPWKLPQGQEGLAELLLRCGVETPSDRAE